MKLGLDERRRGMGGVQDKLGVGGENRGEERERGRRRGKGGLR